MPIQIFSGSQGLPYLANMEMIGGVVLANNRGGFSALPVSGADTANNALAFTGSADKFLLSRSFGTAAASGSVIQALNFLKAKVDAATGIGGSGTDNQVAVFSGASTIDSSANLTFDGSAFAVGGTTTTLSGSSTMSLTPLGAFNLDSSAAVTIESDSAAISIGADAIAGAINVGTGGARTIIVGNGSATEVQVDAVRMDLNAGSNGLQVDSAGATTVSGSSTGAFSYQSGLTLDSSGAVAINSDSAAISIGSDAVAGAINVGTAGGRAISIGSTGATSLDMDAEGAVTLDSTAGSVQIGSILAAGQTLGLGVSGRAQIVVSPNAGAAGSENIAITNTGGTNTITAGAGAIDLHADAGGVSIRGDANSNLAVYLGADNGGVAVAVNPSSEYGAAGAEGFNVINASTSATYAFVNDKGATFPVVRSVGYAVNASGTIGSLALGADAKGSAMTAFPAIGMLGVDSAGLLKQYFLQVSGGMLQVQEG